VSCVHKVLADGLELVARVPTTRIGGLSLHRNCLGTYVTWKDAPDGTGTFS
jgi:hypothetical protein